MADGTNRNILYLKENVQADDILMSWPWNVGIDRTMRPEAIASLPGGKIIISDSGNKCVKMFSNTGTFIGFFARKGQGALRRPHSMTTFPDGTVAVYDAEDKAIKVFAMSGGLIKTIKDECTDYPAPLASSKEGDVVFPYLQTIRFLSIRSNKVNVLHVDTTKNLTNARGVAVSRDYVICCGMTGNDVIFIDRMSGSVVRTEDCLEHPTIEPGLRPLYYGVCVDKSENVYIADADNNRIVFIQSHPTEAITVFDCDEWVSKVLKTYSYQQLDSVFMCPKYLCIGTDGEIYIQEHLGKVKKLKMMSGIAKVVRTSPEVCSNNPTFNHIADINDIETTMASHVYYKCC